MLKNIYVRALGLSILLSISAWIFFIFVDWAIDNLPLWIFPAFMSFMVAYAMSPPSLLERMSKDDL